jgi:hypothetical protein
VRFTSEEEEDAAEKKTIVPERMKGSVDGEGRRERESRVCYGVEGTERLCAMLVRTRTVRGSAAFTILAQEKQRRYGPRYDDDFANVTNLLVLLLLHYHSTLAIMRRGSDL